MNKSKRSIVNLNKLFGSKYKIDVDPAFYVPNQNPEDKEWLYIIPCKKGGKDAHIYTHGYKDSPNALGFYGRKRGSSLKIGLLELPYMTLHVEGNDEYIVTFPLDRFDEVAKIVKPLRRRRLSDKAKDRLIHSGRRYQFSQDRSPKRPTRQKADSDHVQFSKNNGVGYKLSALESTISSSVGVRYY